MRRTIARAKSAAKLAFGLGKPRHHMLVYPDDVFVVSYPKSGNTWTRFLIANLICPQEPASFANIDRIVPEPEELTRRELDRLARPRILKTHRYFDPRYQQVIYVTRDPRDVVVSLYYYFRRQRNIGDDVSIEQFVTRFLAGLPEHLPREYASSWTQNVSSWIVTRFGQPDFLLLRYEDLLSDTTANLKKIALFLGIRATAEQLAQAVERSSADEMRKLERSPAADALCLRNSSQGLRNPRQDIPFVRTARAGNWKSELSQESIAELEAALGPLMRWLGYELITSNQFDSPHGHFLDAVGGRAPEVP